MIYRPKIYLYNWQLRLQSGNTLSVQKWLLNTGSGRATSVFDLSGEGLGVGGEFNLPLVEDRPPSLVTVKSWVFGLGVWFNPHRKVKNTNLSLSRYKLMSDIIQTHPQKALFVMVCRLTASLVILLYLITFKQSFNKSMLFSL